MWKRRRVWSSILTSHFYRLFLFRRWSHRSLSQVSRTLHIWGFGANKTETSTLITHWHGGHWVSRCFETKILQGNCWGHTLYVSAIWSLSKSEEKRLDCCYTHILKKVYNIKGWIKITNEKLSCLRHYQSQKSQNGRSHVQRKNFSSTSHCDMEPL